MARKLAFSYSDQAMTVLEIVDADTGTATRGSLVGLIAPKTAVPSGGFLYVAARNRLYRCDPVNGGAVLMGAVQDSSLYCGAAAPDGVLFFGSYPGGRVLGYDPAAESVIDYGRMDTDGPIQYAYSIAADETHVYVGLGQSPWYLAVLNRATGERTLHFKDESISTRHVERAEDGTLWYGADKLVDGELVSGQTKTAVIPYYEQSGANIDKTTWAARIGYEVNLDDAVPLTNKPAVIRWRAVGEQTWQEYAPAAPPLYPQVIHRVYPFDSTRLLCLSAAYGPVYLYTPATKQVEILGSPTRSLYAASKIADKWYFSGYPAATYEYDPAQPWTLTDSSADHAQTNPRSVFPVSKYHEYSAVGSDGRLYVAVRHERDSVGGELGWYDPTTEQGGSLREPLARWYPRGFAAVGSKIVYSGGNLDGLDGRLFVFDVSDPAAVEREITPLQDFASAGCIIGVGGTDVIGLANVAAYRQNVVTGAEIWRVALPNGAMDAIEYRSRKAEIAPDGLVYFYIGTSIYALDPADGTLTVAVEDGGAQGVITRHNGTAYIYGTTELRRIKFA